MYRVITQRGTVVTEWPTIELAVISMDVMTNIWPLLMFVIAPNDNILATNNAD